ncbi:MAG: DNA primase, partial [Lachnospiraceae bacterium]|nr:DNA primase [Lachnospiraceae bacterium]
MFYSEDIIEEVRSRNDIVDVIQGYVSLRQRGSTYSACCPFHQEKTPSFHVSRSKQMYKCFGCGEGGNVITFVMQYENMTFPEALKLLADRAGVRLPEHEMSDEERRRADYRSMLLEMNKAAAGYFHYLLGQKNGERGLSYLTGRGLSRETIQSFALGFSDITRDDLYKYLRHKGYTDQQLKNSGLVEIDEVKGGYDKFWTRVMFPILDANCHVIGFGGRVMG